MSDETWHRDEDASPCVRLCLIHPEARICIGCHRRIGEIAGWAKMTPEARQILREELPARAALLRSRRGGRRARTPRDD